MGPAFVGGGGGGGWVEDGFYWALEVGEGFAGAFLGELAYANDHVGLEVVDHTTEGEVAVGEEFVPFVFGEFVGGEVGSGFGHEDQGTVVPDEESVKEGVGRFETVACPAPESRAADFAAGAVESLDGAFGVFVVGAVDFGVDAKPVADEGHFAEGYAGLGHAEGSGIHAKEQYVLLSGCVGVEVDLDGAACVGEGVVDMSDWGAEREGINVRGQVSCDAKRVHKQDKRVGFLGCFR